MDSVPEEAVKSNLPDYSTIYGIPWTKRNRLSHSRLSKAFDRVPQFRMRMNILQIKISRVFVLEKIHSTTRKMLLIHVT